ncbi:hypothetical protein [Burkholderia cenocepacia]|uniref:hypothetical protein n=1 Tax=Burkholderia cenocepacia TaxID=95486 RepID=UPI000AD3E3CB|nr:hypothetical protein [Burkholderia cenocepacia]
MKKLMLLAAGIVASLAIVACNSLPTVQQQFQTGCTIVNGDLAILATSPLLSADQQATDLEDDPAGQSGYLQSRRAAERRRSESVP